MLTVALLVVGPIFILSGCVKNNREDVSVLNRDKLKVSDGQQSGSVEIIESDILVDRPQTNSVVDRPLMISGKVVGGISVISFELLDRYNRSFASSTITIQGTGLEDYFSYLMKYEPPQTSTGFLELYSRDSDGNKINKLKLPIKFKEYRPFSVKLFASKSSNSATNCAQVFPLEREISPVDDLYQATIAELIKPLTATEAAQGFINGLDGTNPELNQLIIKDGKATVDFNYVEKNNIDFTPCRLAAIKAQITETIKAMSGASEVLITKNGREF